MSCIFQKISLRLPLLFFGMKAWRETAMQIHNAKLIKIGHEKNQSISNLSRMQIKGLLETPLLSQTKVGGC